MGSRHTEEQGDFGGRVPRRTYVLSIRVEVSGLGLYKEVPRRLQDPRPDIRNRFAEHQFASLLHSKFQPANP
jgi:hypothetical protein